jgi:hypothetical protein
MGLTTSFDDLAIAAVKTAAGERFLVGARAHGELLDPGSIGGGHTEFPPPLDRSLVKALEASGIRPYTLMPESVLRAGLRELGLPDEEIDRRFATARKLITTVTEYRVRGESH